jgi:two-component system nitrogen regulation response regulator GlnG
MQQVFKQMALAAQSHVPVLITGESGTGKELVAQAIHRHGLRKTGPFVPVCLPALSPQLIESELFGHVKGSFTGADTTRTGFLELAAGGTVFLDEIGDVAPPLQVKLLRAIEQQEVTPVGGGQARRTDFRVVAATNRPLDALRAAGEFRADLYYRLSVFRIELPPLRERREDVPLLAVYFLRRADRPGQERRLSDAALAELVRRRWVGNVRELRNVVERAAIAARGDEIHVEHLPQAEAPLSDRDPLASSIQRDIANWARTELHNAPGAESAGLYERFLSLAEPPLFAAALEHAGGNRAAAARELGIHRATLREKLKRNGNV